MLEFGNEEHIRLLKKMESGNTQKRKESRIRVRRGVKEFFSRPNRATKERVFELIEEYLENHGY